MSDKAKILLVDDDPAFLRATSLLVESAGYVVVTAEDGASGLAAAREHKPDLIVLDVIMDRPDAGFALARAIHADPDLAGARTIVLTAAGERYRMLFEPDGQWLPVDKVLEKSSAGDELLAEIDRLVNLPAKDGG